MITEFIVPEDHECLTVGMLLDFLADVPRDAEILCGEHEHDCNIYPRIIYKSDYLVGLFGREPPCPKSPYEWEPPLLAP